MNNQNDQTFRFYCEVAPQGILKVGPGRCRLRPRQIRAKAVLVYELISPSRDVGEAIIARIEQCLADDPNGALLVLDECQRQFQVEIGSVTFGDPRKDACLRAACEAEWPSFNPKRP